MGYKRKARVVFLAGNPHLADMATELGNRLGEAWLECRALPLAHTGGEWRWADLLITLDNPARQSLPALPANTQHRHYPCTARDNVQACLAAHIHSLIGGMKMLDGENPPPIK